MSDYNECVNENSMINRKQQMKNHLLHWLSHSRFNHDEEIEWIWTNNHLTRSIKWIRYKNNSSINHEFDDWHNRRIKSFINEIHN